MVKGEGEGKGEIRERAIYDRSVDHEGTMPRLGQIEQRKRE